MRIGAMVAGVLLVTIACDRQRGGGEISKDPAPRSDATPVTTASTDAGSDADVASDAHAPAHAQADADAEAMPILILASAAPPTTGTIHVAFGDEDALAKAVAEPFGVCYRDALARDPYVAGVLVVRFVVLPNGKVDSPAAGGKTLRDPDLLDCVVVALRRLEFAPPPSTKETEGYAFAFRPYP